MSRHTERPQTFMSRVLFILMSQVVIKLLGLVYRLVITNVEGFGNIGNGYYSAGYQIYTLLLALSSVGIPNAISKMVSERLAVGKYRQAKRIFHTALVLFAGIGAFFSLLMYFGADFIALSMIKLDGVQYTLQALAPSVFFVCISSVIRGYFLGHQDVRVSGTSQVIEQIFKTTLTIVFVLMLVSESAEIMAAAANFATTVAIVVSFLYLLIYYRCHRAKLNKIPEGAPPEAPDDEKHGFFRVARSILWISIPISLSSTIAAFARVIDTATITRGITAAFADGIPGVPGVPTAEMLNEEVARLSGMLSKSDIITNLPLALNIAFATVLVPAIASALAKGQREEASDKVSYSLLVSTLLILPCATGLITLAQPIFDLIYPATNDGADLLQLAAVALIFTALDQTICGALQGIGRVFAPAAGLLCGAAVKVVLNMILIRIPSVNIYGAAYSSIVCHLVAFTVCFYLLHRAIPLQVRFGKFVAKPVLANLIMGAFSIGAYRLLHLFTSSNAIATLGSIALSVVCYAVTVAVMRILDRDEILQLPGGDKLFALLRRVKLYH